jgi:hypothetical protein
MTLNILFSALLGTAVGYPLMKLELKSERREKIRKILGFASQGLAGAVCVLPFMLFRFPAALLIVALLSIASVARGIAAIIFIAIVVYLVGGEFGILLVFICPGVLLIPLLFTYIYYRQTASMQAITLGLAGKKNKAILPKEENVNETNFLKRFVPKQSLHKMAFYCALIIVLIEFSPVGVTTIQDLYSRDRALPYLVQAAVAGRDDAEKALVVYGKEALPLELEILRHRFQNGWKYSPLTYVDSPRSDVPRLTSMILEMGEAESLRQLGSNQKDALRAAASYGQSPASKIAVQELRKLKAIPELIMLLDLDVASQAMDALLQVRPDETIPLLMQWQINTKKTIYSNMNGSHIIDNNSYAGALARYGKSAVPVLIPYLGDENNVVRTLASDTLLLIGEPAVPLLTKALKAGNSLIVDQATYILGQLSTERD